MVAGIDLVQWQIRIAAGEALPFSQADLSQRGHAIECRLYAEDPSNRFLPATGRLLRFIEPRGPGVRVDTGVTTGDEVSVYYDPLIAKLIVHAEDRSAAIRRMLAALRETVLLGITTNWNFLQDVLAHPTFQAGDAHTTWVDEEFGAWQAPLCDVPAEVLIAAALSEAQLAVAGGSGALVAPDGAGGAGSAARDPYSPWQIASNLRLGE
jgi:acetyl/propionyl-CoA carboxylase alpha subunit